MKRIIIALAALMTLSLSSCKKDIDDLGTFDEGIYQPKFRIEAILQGSTTVEGWSWGSSKLNSITDNVEGTTYTFSYSGDQVGSVDITNQSNNQTVNFTYGGSKLTKIEVVNGNRTDIVMTINHNADDLISTINIDFSDAYLVDLAMNMLGSTKTLAYLVGEESAHTIQSVAQQVVRKKDNGAKYSVANKHFSLNYTWSDGNLTKMVLTGNVTATATLGDISEFIDLGALQNYINLIGSNTEFPLSVTVNQTTLCTYDEKNNPFFCLYRSGIDPQNLSKHNLLTQKATGAAEMTLNVTVPSSIPLIGGMEYPVNRSFDMSSNHNYTYTYNKKKLPETYSLDGVAYTINYE